MRLRRPDTRPFALSLGALVGLAGFLATPGPWPSDPVLSLGLGACVAVVAWAAVEQVPDALDRVAEARAHWALAGLGLLPAVGVFGPALFGGATPADGTSIRALVFALAGFGAGAVGSAHRGMLLLKREQVRGEVAAVESRRRAVALRIGACVATLSLLSLATDGALSAGTVVGSVIGAVISTAFTGTEEYELVALDDHLLIHQGNGWGATAIRWRRLREVSVEGDTLRVARGLPYPCIYTADLSEAADRRAVLDAFRSYPFLH
ncbi:MULTISPECIES: hypothetical protein [Halorussus]|uniref:hypothetical protein n=1 Tax=Halorussus TaxID=1070314 RepID=UPI000E21886F|nr:MULTISPECIES: hypothetical protein [Halorussus]NHN57876.1 hypothetical protein [Halorussus sp. JP-T4]